MSERVEVLAASASELWLRGEVVGASWEGIYRRVPSVILPAFELAWETENSQTSCSALPHGDACILPELLGRAVLVRNKEVAEEAEIMAHEYGHYLGKRFSSSSYREREEIADRLAGIFLASRD